MIRAELLDELVKISQELELYDDNIEDKNIDVPIQNDMLKRDSNV